MGHHEKCRFPLIPLVTNAKRYRDSEEKLRVSYVLDKEFEYVHKFQPIAVKVIRVYITRSSDAVNRIGSGDKVVIPEEARETVLREIKVFVAK